LCVEKERVGEGQTGSFTFQKGRLAKLRLFSLAFGILFYKFTEVTENSIHQLD